MKIELDFIYKNLGEEFVQDLKKADIVKLNTSTTLDPEEVKIALQIVPRYILSFLYSCLKHKEDGENCEIDLPFANGSLIVRKFGPDNYSGEIVSEGKRINIFKHRSLPSIGLLIMSSFELYEVEELEPTPKELEPKEDKLQELIDERLRIHNLVSAVVDQKLTQRDAIEQLVAARLASQQHLPPKEDIPMEKPVSKLKQFLENREKRKYHVELDKSQQINCPDCGTLLHKSGDDNLKLCICYGDFRNKEIKIVKNEDGVKLKFPKNFEEDNIEMLLSIFK